jgi:superfamily II DNA or RNA helicase
LQLLFDRGTLLLRGNVIDAETLPGVLWDPRVSAWRAPAFYYRELARELKARQVDFRDEVLPRLDEAPAILCPELRPYQAAAIAAWERAGRRGIISLPTGAGKTRAAIAVMAKTGLRALCLVPTRVLMGQWAVTLGRAGLGVIGEFGDGRRLLKPVTVATFASALRHMGELGNRFDLLVIDEVHHFGSGIGDEAVELCAAPARLGLSATLPEDEIRRARLELLVGAEVYHASVEELSGRYLAPFELVTITVGLTASERRAYDAELSIWRPLCRAFFDAVPQGTWKDFVTSASRSDAGRKALSAWRHSREIVGYSKGKRAAVGDLLHRHRDSRVLIFAANNETAYEAAREFLVQPITCDIGPKERDRALAHFSRGELRILVSARVLNEGLDVPAADIAILVGGSQGTREYVQRVGRVLRPSEGKKAIVYHLVTQGTFEPFLAQKHRRALVAV